MDKIVQILFSIWLIILGLTAAPGGAFAEDDQALEIVRQADARDLGDNRTADMQMILIDKNGEESLRQIKSFLKKVKDDTYHVMFFTEPSKVKDTAFLTYDYDDPEQEDDQWLYLPALRQSKRIAGSNKRSSFMGSDFSYGDMAEIAWENYEWTLLKEDVVGDVDAWLLQAVPRDKSVIDMYGYTKSVFYIRQDNFVVIRAVHWMREGKKLKYMDVKGLEQIEGIWTETDIHMTTKRGDKTLHKTVLKLDNVKYNQELNDDYFTVRQLEKGL